MELPFCLSGLSVTVLTIIEKGVAITVSQLVYCYMDFENKVNFFLENSKYGTCEATRSVLIRRVNLNCGKNFATYKQCFLDTN